MDTHSSRSTQLCFALFVLVAFVSTASAGTITFFDLTDHVTYTDDTGRVSAVDCSGTETCSLNIAAPAGINVFPNCGVAFCVTFIAEPGGLLISDSILTSIGGGAVQVVFSSDTEAGQATCASVPSGCSMVEDGTIQTAPFVIEWRDSSKNLVATDTIKFQSDVSEVPEPSAATLLLSGVLLLAGLRKMV